MEENLQEEIQRLIGRNKTDEAIKLLSQVQFSKADRELIILNSRYNRVKEELMLNTISAEEAERKINQINLALLDLSRKMDGKGDVLNLGSGVSFNRQWLWLLVIPLVAMIWFIIPKDQPEPRSLNPVEGTAPAESNSTEAATGEVAQPAIDDDAADQEAAREQAAREEAARKAAIKKVRFTLNKMLVIEDGDNDIWPTKDDGDYIWTISVNNKILAQSNVERQMDDGDEQLFNESADFELSENGVSKLDLVADITDVDGGLNEDNDRIKITHTYRLENLDFSASNIIKGSKQGDDKGDPKVELFWTLELLPN